MSRSSTLAYVKERCLNFRAALLDMHVVSEDELAAIWPGGSSNPGRNVEAWLFAYWNISRFMGREEARQEFTAGASTSRSDQLLNLQQGTPRVVALNLPIEIGGAPVHEVTLHHKSFTSLRRMATYARVSTQLLIDIKAMEQRPEFAELIVEAQAWRERILLMLVWGAISGDDTGRNERLPWDAWRDPWPTLPDWTDSIDESDVVNIQVAYVQMYGRSLLSVSPFIAPSDDAQDPLAGWETFFAAYATEKGMEAQHLMQDRAFLPFLTQVSIAAHSSRQARESAKSESAAAGVS